MPDELDQLQGFPKGWTDTGMTDINRAFCMGNALIVGIPHEIDKAIAKRQSREAAEAIGLLIEVFHLSSRDPPFVYRFPGTLPYSA